MQGQCDEEVPECDISGAIGSGWGRQWCQQLAAVARDRSSSSSQFEERKATAAGQELAHGPLACPRKVLKSRGSDFRLLTC